MTYPLFVGNDKKLSLFGQNYVLMRQNMKLLECIQDGNHVGYRFLDGETAIDYYGDFGTEIIADKIEGVIKEGTLFRATGTDYTIKETIAVCTEIAIHLFKLYCLLPEFSSGTLVRSKSVDNCNIMLTVKDYDIVDWVVDLYNPELDVVHHVSLSSLRL